MLDCVGPTAIFDLPVN